MISSFGVIAVGVAGALLGGAVFAAIIAAIGLGVYYETSKMTPVIGLGFRLAWPGYAVIFAAATLALLGRGLWPIAVFASVAVLVPVLMIFRLPTDAESISSWVATTAVGAYVGFPVFAAVALRRDIGALDVGWASDLGEFFTIGDDSEALGMAWIMIAILATWLADTFALFVGRSFGRTPLIPHISPKKTLEGAVGGVVGAVVAVIVLDLLLGVPKLTIPLAFVIGTVLALVGIAGDLMESFIKRAAGVKDSGDVIPGHGGIFDRVDALLPVFLVTWAIARMIYA